MINLNDIMETINMISEENLDIRTITMGISLLTCIREKAEDTAINPMQYVNKIIISYKNPGRGFATPYITSIYSGMMLDTYC